MARYQTTNSKEAILLAAEEEFVTKGFSGTRTTEIAHKAGVTHAMLHYYFRTKEELFRAFLDAKVVLLSESIDIFFGPQKESAIERVECGARAYFDFLSQHPELPHFLMREFVANTKAISHIRDALATKITTNAQQLQLALDSAAQRGEIRPTNALDLMRRIMSLGVSEVLCGNFMGLLFKGASPEHNHKQENITLIINSLKPL